MGVHENTPSNGENPFKAPQKETPATKDPDKKFTFTSVMGTVADSADGAEQVPVTDATRPFADEFAETRGPTDRTAREQLVVAPPDLTVPDELRKIVTDIQNTNELLLRLYEPAADGQLDLKSGTVPDGRGGEISVEELHAQLVDQLSLSYEYSLMLARRGASSQATIGATMIGLHRDAEVHRDGVKGVVELLTEVGIFGPDLPASPDIVTAVLAQDIEMDPVIKEKFEDLAHSYQQLEKLDEQRSRLMLLQDGQSIAHLEYAKFLQKFGMPNAAKEHCDLAAKSSPAAMRSEQLKAVEREIEIDRADYLSEEIAEKYVKGESNPFKLIALAQERLKEGDTAGARHSLEAARELAQRLSPEEVEQDIKRIANDGSYELGQLRAKLQHRKENGTITPGQVLMLAERERRLEHDLDTLNSFKMARAKTDMVYASFLLNEDPARNTERNRKQALEILLKVRYDKTGRAAAASEAESFEENLERALQGPNSNQAALEAFAQTMKKYNELRDSAAAKASQGETNEAVAADLEQARNQAELATKIAERIDRKMVERNQQDIRARIERQIEEETSKPHDQQDDGKILLLREIAKPPAEQSKDVIALLLENFKPEGQRLEDQVSLLESVVKDKETLNDLLSDYAIMTQLELQKQALNQARLAVAEIDVMFGRGEGHPYTNDIENDPYFNDFKATLGQTADGKDVWDEIKDQTRDLQWYETATEWFKSNAKDTAITTAAGSGGLAVNAAVAGLTSWSGPGAVIASGASRFASGAAIGALLHTAGTDLLTPGVVPNGFDALSGGLVGGARFRQTTDRLANETGEAFGRVSVADKLRQAASTRFGSALIGSTLSSTAYRFSHEGVNYYEGKHRGFNDFITAASARAMSEVPTSASALILTPGLEKFAPAPAPRIQAFNEYLAAGPISVQLRSEGYYRPAFQRSSNTSQSMESAEKL